MNENRQEADLLTVRAAVGTGAPDVGWYPMPLDMLKMLFHGPCSQWEENQWKILLD